MNNHELKKYIEIDNKSGYKTWESHIKKHFPELYKIIKTENNNWFTDLYNYINNLTENKKCLECEKDLFVRRFSIGYGEYCSRKCGNKNDAPKEKRKKTNLKNYGVDNPAKSNVIKKKIKNKMYKDGIWFVQTDEFKEKTKKTNMEKYGVDSYSKTDEFSLKMKKTSIERYGVDSYNKTQESKEKTKRVNLKKYGVEWYMSTKEFNEKTKKTNLRKYGVDHHTKTVQYKKKMKKYFLNKYGVEYPTQANEIKLKIINTMIERYGEIWVNHAPKYNPNSIIYLDMVSEKIGLHIQHALNGGEKKFIRYWIDGYIEKHNICIEWDEKHHNGTRQKKRDIIKDVFLKENFSCKIIRINENEFLNNIETGIKNISSLILELIKLQ